MNQISSSIDETKIPLKRVLGLFTAILLVAGNIIGTGIFKKIVPMAATGLSGIWILGAWLAAGFITLLGAFVMAGLAKTTTASGGLYEYMDLSFGRFASFILGWTGFSISLSGSIAAIAFIFAQSVNSIVRLPDPLHAWAGLSIGHFIYPFAASGIKILAMATIALLTWFNYRGIKKGSGLNNLLTGLKILGILLLIIVGLFFTGEVNQASHVVVLNPVKGVFFTAFFAAILSAFWAYDGFTNVAYITGEVKNPKRNIPIAIILGVSLVLVLYLLINGAYLKALPPARLAMLREDQIAASFIAGQILGKPGSIMVSLLIMLSSLGTLNVVIIFYARLYYRMAQKGMFFGPVAKVHPRYRTPYISLLYSMLWSLVLVISGTFDMLTDMSVFVSFLFYGLLAAGLIKLKKRKIIKEKIPGYPWAPVLFILFALLIAINTFITQPKLSLIGIGLVLIGVPFYFYFRKRYASVE